ncbi:MAG: hypothetical protein ACLQVY_27315 [Limisphaerales bacterium]
MKLTTKICLILITATAITSLPVSAQSTNTPATTNAARAARRAVPSYRGKISAVDATGMTLTVTGRLGEFKVKVSSKTRITKDGKPATFSDAAEGLNAFGQGKKDADNNWEASTLRLVTPKAAAPAPAPAAKAPASGNGQ